MDKHVWKTVAVVLALTAPTWAAGTVSFELTSPSHGSWVPIGGSVDWTIIVTVSSGDNLGLALVSIDLLQDPANPMLFDLPPADGIPDEMSCFDRSAGIANPVPEGFVSGYRGTPIGTAGQRNLVQIGGAQNTFGAEAGGIGLDVDVGPGGLYVLHRIAARQRAGRREPGSGLLAGQRRDDGDRRRRHQLQRLPRRRRQRRRPVDAGRLGAVRFLPAGGDAAR